MDYHQIVLLHRILVSLFLLHYIVKGYLLLSDKKESLAGYTAKTRIAEMVLSFGFLATGIYLVIAGPALSMLQYIKFGCVLAAIPLAIVGFKRGNRMLAMLSIALIIAAYGLSEVNKAQYKKQDKQAVDTSKETDPIAVGKDIYTAKCTACHGDHGDAGLGGAKNLQITQMTDEQQKDIIKNGKPGTGMSAFPNLSDDQLSGLVAYIKILKK